MMRLDGPEREGEPLPEGDRESIWSIPPALRALYFALFTVYASAGIAFLIWDKIAASPPEHWRAIVVSITQGIGSATVGAAGLALLTIEGPQTVMIIADYIRKRWVKPLEEKQRAEAAQMNAETEEFIARKQEESREEGREEGREQGIEQMHSRWLAWNERRLAAEAKGEPFDEPPPGTL